MYFRCFTKIHVDFCLEIFYLIVEYEFLCISLYLQKACIIHYKVLLWYYVENVTELFLYFWWNFPFRFGSVPATFPRSRLIYLRKRMSLFAQIKNIMICTPVCRILYFMWMLHESKELSVNQILYFFIEKHTNKISYFFWSFVFYFVYRLYSAISPESQHINSEI